MTCPFNIPYSITVSSLIGFADQVRGDIPLFRNESSGEMHGLIRVRQLLSARGILYARPISLNKSSKAAWSLRDICLSPGLIDDVISFSRWDKNNSEKYIRRAWEHAEGEMKKSLTISASISRR